MKKIKRRILKSLLTVIDFLFLGYFHLTRMLVYVLPPRILYATYSHFGHAMYYLVPGARKRVFKVISEAMPEISDPEQIRHIAYSSYGELFKSMPDLLIFARYGDRMAKELTIEGLDAVDKLLETGSGVVVLAAHIGAWAIAMALMARHGYLSTPIVMNPSSTLTPRSIKTMIDFADSIGASNGYILTGDDAIRKARELLEQGGLLVITVDVVGRQIVEMFGRPATLASGAAHFARETRTPMLPVFVLRKEGPYGFHAVLREAIDYDITDDPVADVHNILQVAVAAAERQIRLTPEQWTQWGALGGWWKRAEELKKRRGKVNE